MKLNHLNLTVNDVRQTSDFLEKYFGLHSFGEANEQISLLKDDNDMMITLLKGSQISYPSTFHIGFVQPSEAKVNQIHQQLVDDGFDIKPPRHFHGSWTFYFMAPGNFMIEVLS